MYIYTLKRFTSGDYTFGANTVYKLDWLTQAQFDQWEALGRVRDTTQEEEDAYDAGHITPVEANDEVLEYANFAAFPAEGADNKVYLAEDTEKLYRWNGSVYAEVSPAGAGLALGETSSTAYRGDRGKTAYDHRVLTNNPHAVTDAQVLSGWIFKGLQGSPGPPDLSNFPESPCFGFYNQDNGSAFYLVVNIGGQILTTQIQ
jgi:hypothetical protein